MSGIVVEKDGVEKDGWYSTVKANSGGVVIAALFIIIFLVVCKKDGFASPDGVVAGKASRVGVRSDTEVDRTWNAAELEKSVALINRRAGN